MFETEIRSRERKEEIGVLSHDKRIERRAKQRVPAQSPQCRDRQSSGAVIDAPLALLLFLLPPSTIPLSTSPQSLLPRLIPLYLLIYYHHARRGTYLVVAAIARQCCVYTMTPPPTRSRPPPLNHPRRYPGSTTRWHQHPPKTTISNASMN